MVVHGVLILGGLICAAFAAFMAFFMMGAGHGWVAPFFYSPILFLAYPLVFLRTVGGSRYWLAVDIALMAAGVFADISLARGTYLHEAPYFMRAVENLVGLLWIAIWAMWQLVTAFRIWRAFAHRDAASG